VLQAAETKFKTNIASLRSL